MKTHHFIVAVTALLVGPALAHDAKGNNGGHVSDAGAYHVELVTKDKRIELYVSDAESKPISATGFKAVVVLTVAGKAERIVLEAEPTRLTGQAAVPLPEEPKGAVLLTAPDGNTANARFN